MVNVVSYVSMVLFVIALALLLVDAVVTTVGLRLGYRESNPVLAYVIRNFGVRGLWATRLVAFASLLLLFVILGGWEWVVFGSIFIVTMVCLILQSVNRLRLKSTFRVTNTEGKLDGDR